MVFINQYKIVYILERFIPGDKILTFYFLLTFKNKINCCSIMDTVGLLVPTKQIRDFNTFDVNKCGYQ
jgi:hypothetical protein